MQQKRQVSRQEIIKAYERGERNFSNVSAKENDFTGLNLSGVIFRNSELSFGDFRDAILVGADFSGADLRWSSFERANLKRARFNNANIGWSVFNNAYMELTEMQNADLTGCLFFYANWGAVDATDAILAISAFSPTEITEEGLWLARRNLARLQGGLEPLTQVLIESKIAETSQSARREQAVTNKSIYGPTAAPNDNAYGPHREQSGAYNKQENEKKAYAAKRPYKA